MAIDGVKVETERASTGHRLPTLLDVFSDRASARRVGREFLRIEYDGASVLPEDDAIGTARMARSVSTDQREMRENIRRLIRDDYDEGRTVCVDGWILSITEARLCALATLS
jgi:hypothetical protein